MKRIICCCLIVAALLSLSVAALAAGNEKVTLTASEGSASGTWVITVTVSNADSVRSCQIQPEYPQDVFTLEGVSWKIPVDSQQENPIVAEWNKDTNINGALAEIKLRVKSGVDANTKCEIGCKLMVTDGEETPAEYTNVIKAKISLGCDHPSYSMVVAPEYLKESGGCTQPSTYYASCSVCGAAGEQTFTQPATGTHDFSAQVETEEYLSDMGDCQNKRQYFYSCAICGEKGEETFVSAKKFGVHIYENDCDTECDVCGKYQEPTHQTGEEWLTDETGHWYECSVCLEKVDFAAHVPGPEATAEEHQTCTECGYVLAVSEEHQHEYSPDWSSDEKSHWHECTCTGKSDLAVHSWSVIDTADKTVLTAQCTVCGAIKRESVGTIPDDTTPTQPTQTQPTQPVETDREDGGVDVAVIVLAILLVLSLAGNGVLAWMLFGNKKKPTRR